MAYASVDFDDGEAYVGNRPVETVRLHGPGGPHGNTWSTLALVDTGADYMHLPTEGATAVGISLAGASSITTSTAGGLATMKQQAVDVEFHGKRIHVPVNFAPGTVAVIGRQAIFDVVESAGFTTAEWLLDWWPAAGGKGLHVVAAQHVDVSPAQGHDAPRIVDHGTWLDIGGVAVGKRALRDVLLGDVVL
jgi:predicted aspartyl protease